MTEPLTEEHRAIARAAHELLVAKCTPAVVREAWSDDGRSPALWAQLADVGLTGMTTPTAHGGLGLTDLHASLVLESAGRVALPEPLLETMGVAAPTIAETGSDDQRARWLPGIAAGDLRATVRLPGQQLVSDARLADVFVLAGPQGIDIVGRDRVEVTDQPTFDGARRMATIVTATDQTTRTNAAAPEVERMVDRAAVAAAAVLVGLSAHLLDVTTAYVSERHQFGRPVGSFQAIKHKLAETLLGIETSRQAVRAAARELADNAPSASITASVAKSYASDAARKANYEALQCHGGIGFSWEADLHLWLKRGKALEQAHGSATWHRERIARTLFDDPPGQAHGEATAETEVTQ